MFSCCAGALDDRAFTLASLLIDDLPRAKTVRSKRNTEENKWKEKICVLVVMGVE